MKRLAIVTALLLSASTAYAGLKLSYPVVVTNTYAHGSLGTARNTADAKQSIECATFDGGVGCFAVDAAGKAAACSTSNPELIAQARSLSGDSVLYFAFDATGTCTTISVHTGSYYAPKNP